MDRASFLVSRSFADAEEMSHALRHVNVSAIQIGKGAFKSHLTQIGVRDWSFQYIRFLAGEASCEGNSSADRHSIMVPIAIGAGCRLLGQKLTPTHIGVYAPGSEHADKSSPGLAECVLTLPEGFLTRADRMGVRIDLPKAGSVVRQIPAEPLARLRSILAGIYNNYNEVQVNRQNWTALTDQLDEALHAALAHRGATPSAGRPMIPRPGVLRRLRDIVGDNDHDSLGIAKIAETLGVSYPTLNRIFLEWFGVAPKRYFYLKRMHKVRSALRNGRYPSVSAAAVGHGFIELGRFSVGYRALFGESPAETRARSRN